MLITLCILKIQILQKTKSFLSKSSNKNESLELIVNNYVTSNHVSINANLEMKYILLWTNRSHSPLNFLGTGQEVFKNFNCPWINCYVTDDEKFLGDYTEFEAVLFNGPDLLTIDLNSLPVRRSYHQKYVFVNIESAANYPIRNDLWNGFFNWTWTYKLNSNVPWDYLTVRDTAGKVIGPNINMHWLNLIDMKPIDQKLKDKLNKKRIAAAWFVSNCESLSLRAEVARQLEARLRDMNLIVDVYGDCGTLRCPRNNMEHCLNILERDYYFYFAFENSFSSDYVTEKVLHALQHNTVPIVYGGANYSR